MRGLGTSERRRVAGSFIRPGPRTTGTAAVDFILARRPALIWGTYSAPNRGGRVPELNR